MKIIPQPGQVYVKMDVPTAGMLNTESKKAAVEIAEVLEVGEGVTSIKKGDKIMFKSWGLDMCDKDGEQYSFIYEPSGAIKAVIK